jgi:hypothetical protein
MKTLLIVLLILLVLAGMVFAILRSRADYQPAVEVQFDDAFVAAYDGRAAYEVPETYELANVVIAITEYGLENPYRVYKTGDYYQRVLEHFLPYQDHPLIAAVNYADAGIQDYYSFRENSLAYVFEGDDLVQGGVYPPGSLWRGNGGADQFTQHLDLLADFAAESGFRAFYAENAAFYQAESEAYRQAAPVDEMWTWLETRFDSRYDSYRIVFSPLIYASHSTQRFHDNGMRQTVMFMCGPRIYEDTGFSREVQSGLVARLLFTEVDHNYVGPVSGDYREAIEKAFSPVNDWNGQEDGQLYTSAVGTFDEYMTWGVFLLYARDVLSPAVYEQVESYTVSSMVEGRRFIRFEAFAEVLLQQYQEADSKMIADLYPVVLDWAGGQ